MPIDIAKIKTLREKLGLSQADAAEMAGLTNRQQWNQIETGERDNPTISTLERMAKALGCKAKDLLK